MGKNKNKYNKKPEKLEETSVQSETADNAEESSANQAENAVSNSDFEEAANLQSAEISDSDNSENAEDNSDKSENTAGSESSESDDTDKTDGIKEDIKEEKPKKKNLQGKAGRSKRLKHGALAVTFTVIFVAAIVLVNVIFNMVLERFDFSADLSDKSLYSIDSTTSDYLSKVDDEVSIIVTSSDSEFANYSLQGIQVGQQVSQIIKAFVAANPKFSSYYRSLDDNPGFYSKYSATLSKNSIIVESKKTGRNLIISANDYLSPKYSLDGQEISAEYYSYYYQMGLAQTGRLTCEFFAASESSILSAIMSVTNENPVRVAYVSEDFGCSEPAGLTELLKANAYTIEPIKLTTLDKIDSDIDFVVIYAPIYDFDNDNINKIDMWLDNGGKYGKNLLYAAEASTDVLPNINAYIKEWGLSLESGYVYQTNTDYGSVYSPTTQQLKLEDSDFNKDVDVTTKITQGDGMKPIKLLFDEESIYKTTAIISSYTGAVIAPYNGSSDFDPSKAEESGSFTVAAQSQKTRYEGTTPFDSRIFVMGSHYMLDPSLLQADRINNSDILLNIFNISTGKDKVEISVKPKSFTQETFEISGTQAKVITVIFAVVVPFIVIVVGVVIIVKRKRR